MSRSTLDRRTLLRGSINGAAIAVALPPFEAMLNGNGDAFAAGAPIPKRFGTWFFGCGVKQASWIPASTGAGWQAAPPPSLKPFVDQGVAGYVSVVSNTRVPFDVIMPPHPNNQSHIETSAAIQILGPANSDGNYFDVAPGGPNALDLIRGALRGKTRLDQLDVRVARDGSTGTLNPAVVFDQLFGTGSSAVASGILGARKTMLDAVAADAADLARKLGANDRRRLDDHLDGIHELERMVATLDTGTCQAPPPRLAPIPTIAGGKEPLEEVSNAMADLIVYALACDLTRYFRFTFTGQGATTVFTQLGIDKEYHSLGHDEANPAPNVQKCVAFTMQQCARFVAKMRGVPVGAGNLLDHSCVWSYSEVEDPQTHSLTNVPNLVIGRAGGGLVGGIHHDARGALHTRLLLTMMRALGMTQASFGKGPGQATDAMSELAAG